MRIMLIGFMGSGKSTIGRILAGKTKYSYYDTDDLVESNEKDTISHIFERYGEQYFRKCESKVLNSLAKKEEDIIVSSGGGLPVSPDNRRVIKEAFVTIYLRADVETLCQRLRGDTKRPLLLGGNMRDKIEKLMNDRQEIYEEIADYIIDTDRLYPSTVAGKITEIIHSN